MKNLIHYLQIIASIFLIFFIVIQPKRGGKFFVGDNFLKRRGLEKIIFFLTIFLASFFVVLALFNLFLK